MHPPKKLRVNAQHLTIAKARRKSQALEMVVHQETVSLRIMVMIIRTDIKKRGVIT